MDGAATYADWIAVDWGTSNLRAWAMSETGIVRAAVRSVDGMGSLDQKSFEAVLLELVAPWLGERETTVIACGMVGSRQGWFEAPYTKVPTKPSGSVVQVPNTDPRIAVHILPGLSQESPPDVMRGEETQITGFLSEFPDFDGVICLPGTHSKWAHISAGEVISFQTFVTGELFECLTKHSVLRHSTVGNAEMNMVEFQNAMSETMSKPEALAARLFRLRSDHLLNGKDTVLLTSRLSGYLLGCELAAARPYWLGQEVALIGNEALTNAYASALSHVGVTAKEFAGDDMTLKGLTSAYGVVAI